MCDIKMRYGMLPAHSGTQGWALTGPMIVALIRSTYYDKARKEVCHFAIHHNITTVNIPTLMLPQKM